VRDSPQACRNAGSLRHRATPASTRARNHAGLDGNLLVQLVQTTLLDLPSGEEDPSGELERMQSFARIAEEGGTLEGLRTVSTRGGARWHL
jgi:hypothetical protein